MSIKQTKSISSPGELMDQTRRKGIAWAGYYELTKPRLSLLSVTTALVGYLAALPARDFSLLCHFILGTAICAGGAC